MHTEPSSDPYRVRPGWVRVHRDTLRVLLQVAVILTGALGLWLIGTGPQSDELPLPTPTACVAPALGAMHVLHAVPTPTGLAIAPEKDVPDADAAPVPSLTVEAAPTVSVLQEAGGQGPRSAGAGDQEAGGQEAGGQGPRSAGAGESEAEVRAVVDQGVETREAAAPAGGEALSLEPSGEGAPGSTAQPLSGILPGVFASLLATPALSPTVSATPDKAGQWVWPVRGELSQGYSDAHRAIDISTEQGSVVVAADAGTVVYAQWGSSGYGYLVIVDHHNGFVSYYGHLYGFYVDAGYTVARGEQIGELGTTGRSTGPHLHFEIRQDGVPRNPLDVLP